MFNEFIRFLFGIILSCAKSSQIMKLYLSSAFEHPTVGLRAMKITFCAISWVFLPEQMFHTYSLLDVKSLCLLLYVLCFLLSLFPLYHWGCETIHAVNMPHSGMSLIEMHLTITVLKLINYMLEENTVNQIFFFFFFWFYVLNTFEFMYKAALGTGHLNDQETLLQYFMWTMGQNHNSCTKLHMNIYRKKKPFMLLFLIIFELLLMVWFSLFDYLE